MTDTEKQKLYARLQAQAKSLLEVTKDPIANAANLAALLFSEMESVNWAGFYFCQPETDELIVGPFQGLPACVRIPVGRGVCGTAAALQKTQRVADVHEFSGHIVCDAASRSELVVPLIHNGQVLGVLDVDSPVPGRFDEIDQAGIERLAQCYLDSLE